MSFPSKSDDVSCTYELEQIFPQFVLAKLDPGEETLQSFTEKVVVFYRLTEKKTYSPVILQILKILFCQELFIISLNLLPY